MLLDRPNPRCFRGMSQDEYPQRRLANMGVLHLAASKDGGQELKSHLMLAIFYLATPIGLLRKDPAPLDLGPQLHSPLGQSVDRRA